MGEEFGDEIVFASDQQTLPQRLLRQYGEELPVERSAWNEAR